jgi:hypothetical protein
LKVFHPNPKTPDLNTASSFFPAATHLASRSLPTTTRPALLPRIRVDHHSPALSSPYQLDAAIAAPNSAASYPPHARTVLLLVLPNSIALPVGLLGIVERRCIDDICFTGKAATTSPTSPPPPRTPES